MNRDPTNQRPASPADDAADWFVRLHDDAATGDDWLAFERWLAASPENQAAYDRVELMWIDLDAAADAVKADEPVSPGARRTPRMQAGMSRRGWLAMGGALAASMVLAVVGVSNHDQPAAVTYSSAPGETRLVALADGTKIRLNASSRIAVRFDRRARRVEMADAEATFDVAHDAARPFLISVGDREVRVVGTEFNLRRRGAEMALTVRRGVVEVRPTGAAGVEPTRVVAGQQFIHHQGAANSILTASSLDPAFAWTQGRLIYQNAPLSEVAADLSRSLAVTVRVADPDAGKLRFTGVLMLDDKAAVLRRLEAFAPIRTEQRPDGILLHRR